MAHAEELLSDDRVRNRSAACHQRQAEHGLAARNRKQPRPHHQRSLGQRVTGETRGDADADRSQLANETAIGKSLLAAPQQIERDHRVHHVHKREQRAVHTFQEAHHRAHHCIKT